MCYFISQRLARRSLSLRDNLQQFLHTLLQPKYNIQFKYLRSVLNKKKTATGSLPLVMPALPQTKYGLPCIPNFPPCCRAGDPSPLSLPPALANRIEGVLQHETR